jgi:8-oxo-dGTP pyrophosphatase MutT (NUDIX family)
VTPKGRPAEWIFPKGHVEQGETLEVAAIRELHEEAGLEGAVAGRVGASRFRSKNEDVEVTYFLVLADAEGHGEPGRQIRWLPFVEARAVLTFDDARRLLDTAHSMLEPR